MARGLLGRKLGMTQIFDADGNRVPVTLIEAGPCVVLQVKRLATDGYNAVQLGFADRPRHTATRPHRGHVAKANTEPKRFVREFRRDDVDQFKLGQEITVEELRSISRVDVIGTTKGRGFQGGMKRYGFKGKEATHGAKKVHRQIGSVGTTSRLTHTPKGKRMPGHMGAVRRTARHLKIVEIQKDKNLLVVQGSVPGANGGFVVIREAKKA